MAEKAICFFLEYHVVHRPGQSAARPPLEIRTWHCYWLGRVRIEARLYIAVFNWGYIRTSLQVNNVTLFEILRSLLVLRPPRYKYKYKVQIQVQIQKHYEQILEQIFKTYAARIS